MMKKLIAILLCAALLGALAGCGAPGESVTVQSVAMICGTGAAGFVDRCAGKVVSGQTAKVTKDANKTVLEVFVQVGDMVEEGGVLFSYDAAAMKLELEKMRLELQILENSIVSATSEIADLEKHSKNASAADKLQYAIQIDTKNADIREAEYKKALKAREIQSMEAALEATEVTAPIAGRVMSINTENSGSNGMEGMGGEGGEAAAFITIMDMTSYRIQGNINELNLYSLTVGMPVLIRSRMDGGITWHGTIESIDWENPVSGNNNNNMYYFAGPSDEMTSTSKYPFYVTLESLEGLVLGQHVYVEPDFGQEDEKGLFLPAMYILDAETNPHVWAAGKNDKLEKRSVVLGSYDAELDRWLVTGGVSDTDYLAFPADNLSSGQSVIYYGDTTGGSASGGNASDGDLPAEGGEAMPEAVPEAVPEDDGSAEAAPLPAVEGKG